MKLSFAYRAVWTPRPLGPTTAHLRRTARIDPLLPRPHLVESRDHELRIVHATVLAPDPWLPLWITVAGTCVSGTRVREAGR